MTFSIRIDANALIGKLDSLARTQVPFALAKALTQTGIDGQKAERERLHQRFTLRRADFIEKQGVKLMGGIATKARPSITFGVDPKASFLDKFEDGGDRPKRGQSIMIPVDVRRNKKDIITRGNRPRALLANRQRAGAGGVFLLRTKRGKLAPGLYQRTGRAGRGGVKLLFAAEQHATIPPSLGFVLTFKRVTETNWRKNFDSALAFAIKTAK